MPRPSIYSDELAIEICVQLANGSPLTKVCGVETMPGLTTVYRWLSENNVFRDMYARAREDQADTLADEVLAIADESPELSMLDHGANAGSLVVDGAAIQHQKLRIDARKWVAAKLKPRKYSDRVSQEVTGADGGPLRTSLTVEYVRPPT